MAKQLRVRPWVDVNSILSERRMPEPTPSLMARVWKMGHEWWWQSWFDPNSYNPTEQGQCTTRAAAKAAATRWLREHGVRV